MNLVQRMELVRNGLNVRRFHQHPTHQINTVGAHSAGVALMCLLIDPLCSREVLAAALTHDLGEWRTGDIPAPTKKMVSSAAKDELAAVEKEALAELDFEYDLSDAEVVLVKLGDYFDGVSYCFEEIRMGNRGLISVADTYLNYLWQYIFQDKAELLVRYPWRENAHELFNHFHRELTHVR